MGGICSILLRRLSFNQRSLHGELVFSADERDIFRETMPVLEENPDEFGTELFESFFEKEPQMLRFFKRMENDRGGIDLNELASHGRQVLIVFPLVINNIGKLEDIEGQLRDYGKSHYRYNTVPEQFYYLWPPLRDTLSSRLGDGFDHAVELAWKHLFDYIAYHMGIGLRKEISQQEKTCWAYLSSLRQNLCRS